MGWEWSTPTHVGIEGPGLTHTNTHTHTHTHTYIYKYMHTRYQAIVANGVERAREREGGREMWRLL